MSIYNNVKPNKLIYKKYKIWLHNYILCLFFSACDITNCNSCTDSNIGESCDDELYLNIDNEQYLCVFGCDDRCDQCPFIIIIYCYVDSWAHAF